jgi:6-phosphogluconolactonase (cycloisomerase 2 family)
MRGRFALMATFSDWYRPTMRVRLFRIAASAGLLVLISEVAKVHAAPPGLQLVQVLRGSPAGGTVPGLEGPRPIVVSPDGAYVYVGSEGGIHILTRESVTGELTPVGSPVLPPAPVQRYVTVLQLSPDGRHLYASTYSGGWIVVFERNDATGALTPIQVYQVDAGKPTLSPDGLHLYAPATSLTPALYVLARDAVTGMLTFVEEQRDGVNGVTGLYRAAHAVVTADGADVYVAAFYNVNGLTHFRRDPLTGALTFVSAYPSPDRVVSIAISPDDRHLYTGGRLLSRDPLTGALSLIGAVPTGYVDAFSVDGRLLAGEADSIVEMALFDRDSATGMLSLVDVQRNGVDGVSGLREVGGLTWSPDGRHLYVAGEVDDAVIAFRLFTIACTPTPQPGCRRAVAPGGVFKIVRSPNPEGNRLLWRWHPGEATDVSDFGAVEANEDVALCLYDEVATGPLTEAVAPAGGLCRQGRGSLRPCWQTTGASVLSYRDRGRFPHGVIGLDIRAGEMGGASIRLKARGAEIPLPSLPLTPPLTVQLQSLHGPCWTAIYSAPNRNDGTGFKATSD